MKIKLGLLLASVSSVALAAVPPIPPSPPTPATTVTAGTNISVSGAAPNYTINNTQVVPSYAAGSGVSITGSSPNYTINNTAVIPSYAAGTNISITGSSPNFTINNTAAAPPTAANPTASVGTSAVNGVASTFMRSDAAPALGAGAALANLGGAGQLTATATNDNAAAGKVGEFICAQVTNGGTPTGCATNTSTPVSLTSATVTNVTSVSLTAGDWDVWGSENIVSATGTTGGGLVAAIGTVSATLPTQPAMGGYVAIQPAGAAAGLTIPAGITRISVASTTTVYLVGYFTYTGGATTVGGFLGARRVR